MVSWHFLQLSCTTLLILFLGLSSQIYIIIPWPSLSSEAKWRTLFPFNVLLALLLYNYYLCITVDPGRVPVDWVSRSPLLGAVSCDMDSGLLFARAQRPNHLEPMQVKSLTRTPRYCRTCKAYKPPRAHHCKKCKRCVLKMDHHCPWVNNCVGHHNYPHFLRFLIYVDLATAWHLIMLSRRVFYGNQWVDYTDHEMTKGFLILLVMNYVLCLPTFIAVGIFSLYHLWCLASNTTTIESWEKEKFKYPYHLSFIKNIQAVLGSNPLLWLVPGQKAPGDGLKYKVGKEVEQDSQYLWPPKDPYLPSSSTSLHRDQVNDPSQAFTYGAEALNPTLSSQLHQRKRKLVKSDRAPYEQSSGVDDDDDDDHTALDIDEGEEDDIPLATLRADQTNGRVRLRRGSEGYEVRPRGPWGMDDPGLTSRLTDQTVGFERPRELDEWQGLDSSDGRYRVYRPGDEEAEGKRTDSSEDDSGSGWSSEQSAD
ncbi:BZ3500_MvSof-1268-A1-R1_Chr6-2g08437 [Microbotryum saponariae]|uniref:Palmitoyltransferase PFA4 n=1 Tax=Microbotryum saponariae TaxID=289078 RepID=A0A2X0KHK9_9BASI|nr:BZ3500_MvSof-1268-A1-R1_Chr6-2g08437 [Microbotryum saponariae]SDA07714.1 BZ3501_MvSof-1269-A2-R1_Chr6-1g08151 [Microbotryum saponariae]